MMYWAVGLDSGKIYAKGRFKNDCLRKLNKQYPYKTRKGYSVAIDKPVLPEPIILRKG